MFRPNTKCLGNDDVEFGKDQVLGEHDGFEDNFGSPIEQPEYQHDSTPPGNNIPPPVVGPTTPEVPETSKYTCFPADGKDLRKAATAYMQKQLASSTYADLYGPDIEDWCVKNIEDFSFLFELAPSDFNPDLSRWNVDKATDMRNMFTGASGFNQNLCSWGTKIKSFIAVSDMLVGTACPVVQSEPEFSTISGTTLSFCKSCGHACFQSGKELRKAVQTYLASDPTGGSISASDDNLAANTYGARISDWCVDNVEDFSSIFSGHERFNQDLSSWNTASATNMNHMFYRAKAFNGDISTWDTSKVRSFANMFHYAATFNRDVSKWDTGHAVELQDMFHYAVSFNADITKWTASRAGDMSRMFRGAKSFAQYLG